MTKNQIPDMSTVEVGFRRTGSSQEPFRSEIRANIEVKRTAQVDMPHLRPTVGRRQQKLPDVVSEELYISVDVFDTLLHRKPVSERRRFYLASKAFARMCSFQPAPSAQSVYAARCEANRWAYHSIDALDHDSEVKLADIFQHQLLILGLPGSLLSILMAAEIEVEKKALVPNRPLIEWLKHQRHRKVPVIAISDTSMSSETLQEVIDAVAGPGVVDRLYTSADVGLSKRNGGIFSVVASLEGMPVCRQLHFGDDRRADFVKARAAGVHATHLPRSRTFVALRKADGARFQLLLAVRHLISGPKIRMSVSSKKGDGRQFGRQVLGPIFARYCLRMWLYLSFASQSKGAPVALFCARGGLQLHTVFETFLKQTRLPLDAAREDLMTSRLVSVRAALLQNSPSALDEIAREFGGASMASIAQAIAQANMQCGPEWNRPFDAQMFQDLMKSTAAGERFRQRLVEQNELFTRHLEDLVLNKKRLILCDTGLFGSTLRMLQGGFPTRDWECLLFARSNYKGFASDHFAKTRGLISERNMYNPLHNSSTVLRYWQLFEHILEPELQSVKTFTRGEDGNVISNLETGGWRECMNSTRSSLLQGILDYFAELPRDGWFEKLCSDEPKSWRALKTSMLFPDSTDICILNTGERSHDFGRDEKYKTLPKRTKNSLMQKLRTLRTARWKEGYVAQEFPALRPCIQTVIESFYILRWLASRRS